MNYQSKEQLDVEFVLNASTRIIDSHTVEVAGETYKARALVLAREAAAIRLDVRAEPLTFAGFRPKKTAALRRYETDRSGPLASNFLEAGAFVKSDPSEKYPGLKLFLLMTLAPDYPEAGPPSRHRLISIGLRAAARLGSPPPIHSIDQ